MSRIVLILAIAVLSSCTSKPKEMWSFTTGGPVYASPNIYKDKLIIGSQDHNLYALDLKTGKQQWKLNLNERVFGKPLIINDSLYIGSAGGDFFHIDPTNANVRWKFKAGSLIHYNACSDDSGIYFGSNNGTFYKIDYSGNKLWEYKTTNKFWGTCVFYNNVVMTSSWDKNFYGLDRNTGEVLWKVPSGILNFGQPELVGSDVYFASHDVIYRINAQNGQLISKAKTTHLDHVVSWKNFLWTNEQGIVKRKLDGTALGSVKFQSVTDFKPVATPKYLILSGDSTMLFAVSEDLKIVWKYKGKDSFWAPGVVHQNVYYTGNRDHKVYAIQLPAN